MKLCLNVDLAFGIGFGINIANQPQKSPHKLAILVVESRIGTNLSKQVEKKIRLSLAVFEHFIHFCASSVAERNFAHFICPI